LADGDSLEEILEAFPSLTEQDVRAITGFATSAAMDDLPFFCVPTLR
jgi:uncharacterized protein (DUF433 family)